MRTLLGLAREHERVPDGISHDGCQTGRPLEPDLLVLVPVEEGAEGARRAGLRLGERRDVDPDAHYSLSESASYIACPVAVHVNGRAWSSPRQTNSSRRATAPASAADQASGSSGSARRPTSPEASSSDGCDEATTGTALAIASTIGMPKPSKREGYANAA